MRINLLDELSKKKAFTIEDAEQISQANKEVLKVILSRLEKNGWIERIEKGKYIVIPLGAEKGKYTCIKSFTYEKERYGRWYRCKDVMPIFADEEMEIVVITVYTFFSQKGVNDET